MFLLRTSEYDCTRSSFFLQNKENAEKFNNFTRGLSAGNYVVRVYDVEGNGEVHSLEPAVTKPLVVEQIGKEI